MGRSFLIFASLCVCAAVWSCSIFEFGDEDATNKPGAGASAAAEPKIDKTATLTITPGIRVLNVIALPAGFAPIPTRPPMWLENGQELGIVGIQNGQIVVLGFSGAGWQSMRVITAETGRETAEPGNIVDVQPSPDGLTLAYAVALPKQYRLDIILRDLIATGPGMPAASFDGLYDSATMHWLNGQSIAVALRLHPGTVIPPPPPPSGEDQTGVEPEPAPKPVDGLQIVVVSGPGSAAPLKLNCTMMPLDWSPRGIFAIGDGGGEMPPILIDRRRQTCRNFIVPWPIHVLTWEPNSDSAFLYQGPDPTRHSRGVYKYDLAAGEGRVVAVSSGAGAYTSTGAIITLGNQKLTYRMVEDRPDMPINAEVAILDPAQGQTSLKSLGFQTTPELLARSTMAFSTGSNRAAIEAFAPDRVEPMRKILTYSVERDNAFLIAQGPDRGTAAMSWSPHGRWLALVDGDTSSSTLAIIQPPE
jgi:hypothetical protein